MKIVKKTVNNNKQLVYDITVKDDHHYILHNGIVSHNSYVPTQDMSGGGGIKYGASTILFINKSKDKDSDKNVVGAILKVHTYKSRYSKEHQKVELKLDFNKGLDKFWGLLEIGLETGVLKKHPKHVEFPDGRKVGSGDAGKKEIYGDPESWFTKDVLDAINEKCKYHFGLGETIESSGKSDTTDSDFDESGT